MTRLTPSASILFEAAKKALSSPQRVLILAPIGPGGEAEPNQPFQVITEADTARLVGASEAREAVKLWFAANLQNQYDLFVLGYDTEGWTPNDWTITAGIGTALSSASLNVRLGDYHVPVAVNKGNTEGDIAAQVATAINAAPGVPFTAEVNAANVNQVDVTCDYVGLHTQRIPVSVDLYRDRGELGVDGITVDVVNQATGSGEPLLPTEGPAFPLSGNSFDWYLHPFRGVGYLDKLEEHLQNRWDSHNDFAHAITALAGSESTVTAFGATRNDRHHTYVAGSDAPITELSAAVAFLDGVERQAREQGKPNISGQGMVITRMPSFPTGLDSELVLKAGVTALRSQRATVLAVRAVANRRRNDDGAADLTTYDLGAVLALREIGNRLARWTVTQLGKGIVADGVPLSTRMIAETTSPGRLRGGVVEVLKGLWRDAIIFAKSETDVDQVLSSIEPTKAGGIDTGFELVFNADLVRNVTNLNLFVRYA